MKNFKTSKRQPSFFDDIIVDHFCGGGGASTGIELALGRIVDVAVNHDPAAIAMHSANHRHTYHYQKDVFEVDPKEATWGRRIMLMWCSPDCTHFSKAKGGTPLKKKIRGLAWLAVKWAKEVRPRVIMLENVPEFVTWCPLTEDNRPDKTRTGETFREFVAALRAEGYAVDWRVLSADDYGAGTSRKRLYLVARCDGQPIIFPAPTHGAGLLPKHTAAEYIDFSLRGKSIFNRKKPLATATMRRIARGLDKFTIKNQKPFIIPIGYGERQGQAPRLNDIDAPLGTIVSIAKHNAVNPVLSPYVMCNNNGNTGSGGQEPLHTVTGGNRHYLTAPKIAPFLTVNTTGNIGNKADEPTQTVTGVNKHFLVNSNLAPFISSRFGGFGGDSIRGRMVNKPLPTITAEHLDHNEIITAHISKYFGGNYQGAGTAADKPLDTITGIDHNALVAEHLCVFRKNVDHKPVTEPLPTITAGAEHYAEIKTYLVKYSDGAQLGNWADVRQLLNQYAGYTIAEDELLIIELDGTPYFIADIEMRMLTPRELYGCQGFPPDYNFELDGKLSKSEQIKKVGNSVCPHVAAALVRANLPEYAAPYELHTMQDLLREVTA